MELTGIVGNLLQVFSSYEICQDDGRTRMTRVMAKFGKKMERFLSAGIVDVELPALILTSVPRCKNFKHISTNHYFTTRPALVSCCNHVLVVGRINPQNLSMQSPSLK